MIDQAPDINNDQISNLNLQTVTEQCITQTAKRFKLSDIVLKAILEAEQSNIGELRTNPNGSYNMGPMQVNSKWLPQFKSYASKDEILYNGCTNVQIGAWVLQYHINKANGNLWKGLASYNYESNQNDIKNKTFRNKVHLAMQKLKDKYSNDISKG